MIHVNEIAELTDIEQVNEKLRSGWILIETIKDSRSGIKYIIGHWVTR